MSRRSARRSGSSHAAPPSARNARPAGAPGLTQGLRLIVPRAAPGTVATALAADPAGQGAKAAGGAQEAPGRARDALGALGASGRRKGALRCERGSGG